MKVDHGFDRLTRDAVLRELFRLELKCEEVERCLMMAESSQRSALYYYHRLLVSGSVSQEELQYLAGQHITGEQQIEQIRRHLKQVRAELAGMLAPSQDRRVPA